MTVGSSAEEQQLTQYTKYDKLLTRRGLRITAIAVIAASSCGVVGPTCGIVGTTCGIFGPSCGIVGPSSGRQDITLVGALSVPASEN